MLGAGATQGSMDAANLIKPPLARGELRCIGATTLDEYRKYVEKVSTTLPHTTPSASSADAPSCLCRLSALLLLCVWIRTRPSSGASSRSSSRNHLSRKP